MPAVSRVARPRSEPAAAGVLATVHAPAGARPGAGMAARRAPLVPCRVAKARFLLRPRWLLSHLLVVLLVVTMVSLGFWQLRRLDEKRDRNALIESRMEQPIVPVEDVLDPGRRRGRRRPVPPGHRHRHLRRRRHRGRPQPQPGRCGRAPGWSRRWRWTTATRWACSGGSSSLGADGAAVQAPAPEGEVTVEGLVVDPGSFDGTAPEGPRGRCSPRTDTLPGLVLAETSTPPEPDGASPDAAEPARSWRCPRPSCPRARTSATRRSGSSSRRSRSSGTRSSCAGS